MTQESLKGITKEAAAKFGFFVQVEEYDYVIINGKKIPYHGDAYEIILDKKFYITDLKKPIDCLNLFIEKIKNGLYGVFFNYKVYPNVRWTNEPLSDFPNCGWMDLEFFDEEPEIVKSLLCFMFSGNAKNLIPVSMSEAIDDELKTVGRNKLEMDGTLYVDGKKLSKLTKKSNNTYSFLNTEVHIFPETILNMKCPNPVNYMKIFEDDGYTYFYNSSGITFE